MNKSFVVVFFGMVLLIPAVCALDNTNNTDSTDSLPFNVSIEIVNEKIDFQENARFKIIIENPRSTIETFTIKPAAPYVEWFIKTDPASDYSVKVYPWSKKEIYVIAKPISVGIGRYALRMNIIHEKSKETFKKDIVVNVVSMSNVPAVSISGKIPEKVDPREPFKIEVWLENRNAKNLVNLSVELKSNVIMDSIKTNLGAVGSGNDKKTIEFSIALDRKTAPRKDGLKIVIRALDNKEVYELKSPIYDYEIIQYGGLVDKHNPEFKFLGKYDKISFVNDANVKFEGIAKIRNPLYAALFTKTEPKAVVVYEEGKRYIGWAVNLEPQDKFDVVLTINYLPFFIFLTALIIILIAYFVFRSPIVITKSTQSIARKDRGIIRFDVILKVKNRSNDSIENIAIIDRIPDIADFDKEAKYETITPSKIFTTPRGVVVKWNIGYLDKQEESLIKYSVKSRLSILGGLRLPIAVAKFLTKNNKVKKGYSNSTKIMP